MCVRSVAIGAGLSGEFGPPSLSLPESPAGRQGRERGVNTKTAELLRLVPSQLPAFSASRASNCAHLTHVAVLPNVRFAPTALIPNRSFRDLAVANDRLTESDLNLSKHRLNARDVAGGNRNSNSPARCGKTG
jgi:hypothetical protein